MCVHAQPGNHKVPGYRRSGHDRVRNRLGHHVSHKLGATIVSQVALSYRRGIEIMTDESFGQLIAEVIRLSSVLVIVSRLSSRITTVVASRIDN